MKIEFVLQILIKLFNWCLQNIDSKQSKFNENLHSKHYWWWWWAGVNTYYVDVKLQTNLHEV